MNKSDRAEIEEMLRASVPIDKVERIVAIVGLIVIDLYALSQGINSGLTHVIVGAIGGIVGYSLHRKRGK